MQARGRRGPVWFLLCDTSRAVVWLQAGLGFAELREHSDKRMVPRWPRRIKGDRGQMNAKGRPECRFVTGLSRATEKGAAEMESVPRQEMGKDER